MKTRTIRSVLALFFGVLVLGYLILLLINRGHELPMDTQELNTEAPRIIAIFGATGTIGDGLLKASMSDSDIDKIHVVTRLPSPRIE